MVVAATWNGTCNWEILGEFFANVEFLNTKRLAPVPFQICVKFERDCFIASLCHSDFKLNLAVPAG